MAWVLLWVVLVLGALVVLAGIGRSLWGKTAALLAEARRAGMTLAELERALAQLENATAPQQAEGTPHHGAAGPAWDVPRGR
jgi:uncharacterized protein HemX